MPTEKIDEWDVLVQKNIYRTSLDLAILRMLSWEVHKKEQNKHFHKQEEQKRTSRQKQMDSNYFHRYMVYKAIKIMLHLLLFFFLH